MVTSHPEFVREHITAYLSNWRQLIDLSEAYGYKPVCVLQPTGNLERDYALPLLMRDFHLTKDNSLRWMDALSVLYEEADDQIEDLSKEYPDVVFMNLRDYLTPAQEYFWDPVHVYDEANMKLAEKIYKNIEHLVQETGR